MQKLSGTIISPHHASPYILLSGPILSPILYWYDPAGRPADLFSPTKRPIIKRP